MKGVFVTGIGTEVGKTVVSATLVEAFATDYWKPVQAGDLETSDRHKVSDLAPSMVQWHPERHALTAPMSPHAAARIDGVSIKIEDFTLPETQRPLVVEGAGGLMVPLNDDGDLLVDLIAAVAMPVVLVSAFYLGSINHTLLSAEALASRGITVAGIIFNGPLNEESRSVILSTTGLTDLGHLPTVENLDVSAVQGLGTRLDHQTLRNFLS